MINHDRYLKTVLIDGEGKIYPSYLGDFKGKSFVTTDDENADPHFHDEFIILTLLEKCHTSKRVLSKIKKARLADLRQILAEEGMALLYDWTNYDNYKPGKEKNALLYLPYKFSEPLKNGLIQLYQELRDDYASIPAGVEGITKKQAKKFPYSDVTCYDDLIETLELERGISK